MARQRSRLTSVGVGMIAIAMLAGCSSERDADLPVFEGERQAVDVLPATITEQLSGPDSVMDLESSRYVGEHNEAAYYIALDRAGTSVCITISPSGGGWGSGCGGTPGFETSVPGHSARFTLDGIVPSGEEWTVLHENVLVR